MKTMSINKKNALTILFLSGIFLLSPIFGISGVVDIQTPSEVADIPEGLLDTEVPLYNEEEIVSTLDYNIDFTGEELIDPTTYDRSIFEWRPIEETLKLTQSNEETDGGSIATASYNVATGIETITAPQFSPSPESGPDIRVVEPYVGLLAGTDTSATPEAVIGTDERTLSPNTVFPYKTVVKLYISDPWGGNWVGSGAIIDNFHVLTAGHCAYIRDSPNFGWATSIEVVPAMDTSDTYPDPYGSAWVTGMRSYTGWTVSGSSQHDWAVLTLDRNVGFFTGSMGRITAGSSSSIYNAGMNVAGYPTDLSSGNRQYRDITNAGDGATANNHYYWADTAPGMSGGPVWRYDAGNRYIMTVHAYGRGGTASNFGTRLNNDKYDRIFTWLSADSAPTDKADLIDRGSLYSSYSPGSVTAGTTFFSVNNQIRNVGTASSGTYYVHYYASTNTYISTSDYYIGTSGPESAGAFGTDAASWSGTFPNIPGGNYYIGWIIDKDDTVDEFDETNNKAYISTPLTVIGLNPPISYIEVRVRDSLNVSVKIPSAYVKTYVSGTATLIDTGYTDTNGFYNVTNLAVGTYDVKVSKVGYMNKELTNVIHNLAKGYDDDYLYFNLVAYGPDTSWIEVNVRDSGTSNPLVSAFVQVTNMSSGLVIDTGWTNGAGFYNVTGLYIGWYEVTISKVGYQDQTKQNYINWNFDDDYLWFYLVQKPATSGYIEVRTFNESGAPLSGVLIQAWNNSGATLVSSGYTNINGTYNITGLVIGWVDVNASVSGWQEQSKSTYINWNGDDDYLSFWMVPNPPGTGYIDVSVYDSVSFLPLSWAKVEVTNQSTGLVFQTGYTDFSGFYKVVNLTIGWFTIEVTKEGYHGQSKQEYINWNGDDDYLSFYMVSLPPDSGYIEVTVKDDDTNAPIQNALVTTYYINGTFFDSGYTDSSGFYNVTGLYIGWYEVVITHTDYGGDSMNDYINWNGDDDYLSFFLILRPPGWIEVTVFDIYNLNPIPGAYVRCYNDTSGEFFDDGYTDGSGFYNITGLLIGWWTVNVSHPNFAMQSKLDYINWRGDDDYLSFYLDTKYEPFTGSIAIFRDRFPWQGAPYGHNVTEPILVANGISYDIYNSSDMGIVDLSPYQKVIINSDQTQAFYDRLAANTTWFESYVSNGGFLLISACDWAWGVSYWDEANLWPGGFNRTHIYFNTVNISLSWHPVLFNPNLVEDDELDGWNSASHGYFIDYPSNANEILIDPTTGNPVLIEFKYGDGFIVTSTQPLEWNHGYNFTGLFENLILFDPAYFDNSINVTSPISSEYWESNTVQTITWDSTGSITNVKISLYENGVFVMELTASTPNDGSYSLTVPIGLTDSILYQIRVSNVEYAATEDYSDNFEIEDPRTITVVVPDSTTSWTMGDVEAINWTSTGIIANVKIELYASSFLIMEIVASTLNDGTFDWTIPNTLLNYTVYIIRISDVLDPTLYDDSEPFSILAPPGGGIPGYDMLILGGLLGVVSLVIIKRKRKKLSIS
ncbi:hypothetical protein LCGC14_0743540 [marine sediment metagenome]|uniref:Peptidase S1 domain-containing protein n=1 Tax=marine sediment metagenome TaxID=412755 RepID=A0A0F9TD45_9ZZZZ